jgi:hypothetical protein
VPPRVGDNDPGRLWTYAATAVVRVTTGARGVIVERPVLAAGAIQPMLDELMNETAASPQQLVGEPQAIQDEIIDINTDGRHIALQVALLIPLLAGLVGTFNAFRMMRLPDPVATGAAEAAVLG